MAVNDKDYALVIGLNDYPTYGAGGRSLKGAIHDAEEFANWLRNDEDGGALPDSHVKLITSTADPLAPSQQDIDGALEEIKAQSSVTGARRLYFYFSGHGHVSGELRHDVALCLPHWSRDRRNAALSSSKYLDYLLKCTDFPEIIMLLDCCRVKQVAAIGKPSDLDCPLAAGGGRRVMIAYASEFLKPAFEAAAARGGGDGAEPDTSVDEVRGHFTEALLAGLRGGAAKPNGGVTARELKRYLEDNVSRVAQRHSHEQVPQVPLDMSDQDADALVFGSAQPLLEANLEIRFAAGRTGVIELIGPTGDVLKSGEASTGPWRLRLEKGLYLLVDTAAYQQQPLRFMPGAEVLYVDF